MDHTNLIIAISVGVTVTFLIVVAVLIYLLLVYLKTRRASMSVALSHKAQGSGDRNIDLQFLAQAGAPTWRADVVQTPPPQTNGSRTLTSEEGYHNIINAAFTTNEKAVEHSEPLYMNTRHSASQFIADNTPEYDYIRQNRAVLHGGRDDASVYDYPPRANAGFNRFNSDGDASEYDYPRNNTTTRNKGHRRPDSETPYDYPKRTNESESEYDYPKRTKESESEYDFPPNNASVGPEAYGHAMPYTGEQPIYSNLGTPEESLYDRPPPPQKEVSFKRKSSKRNLAKFKSPFTR